MGLLTTKNMIYHFVLKGEDSKVWVLVEAQNKGEAEQKALAEYPNREIVEFNESYYNAIIK